MKKFALVLTAAMVSFSTVGAYAGGWGGSSGSLINVSPSIGLGQVNALNGILSGNNILSGNVVQGILDGNKTNVLSGVLNGVGANLLGGNTYKLGGHR